MDGLFLIVFSRVELVADLSRVVGFALHRDALLFMTKDAKSKHALLFMTKDAENVAVNSCTTTRHRFRSSKSRNKSLGTSTIRGSHHLDDPGTTTPPQSDLATTTRHRFPTSKSRTKPLARHRSGRTRSNLGMVTTATTYSVTTGNFHLLLQFIAAFNVNLVLTVYFQGRTGTPFVVVPSTSNESDDSDPTELNNQDNGVMLLRSTEAKSIKDSVKASLLEVTVCAINEGLARGTSAGAVSSGRPSVVDGLRMVALKLEFGVSHNHKFDRTIAVHFTNPFHVSTRVADKCSDGTVLLQML
ncbi:hypothetical protein L2E82_12327 [Cichorium intybus]|uniref:Uncharacterized protein n=1 Tax=Cichorium intybus TaxID=13427 RepID=A0ACB9GFN5_CICIN|nr:hypothetical protein L2E82_12327 [Cichorium intybus]